MMVSISNTSGHEGSFGDFQDHDHNHPSLFPPPGTSDSTENLLLASTSKATVYSQKYLIRKFPGTILIILYAIFVASFEVMSFVLHQVLHVKILGGLDAPFAFLTVIHIGVWVFTFVYDRYLHFNHHKLRRLGYLSFYMKTKEIRRIPFMVFSIGNATLLLVVSFSASNSKTLLIKMFQWTVTAEVGIVLISIFIYLGYVIKFNKAQKLPDVYVQDLVEGFNGENYSTEVGFRDNESVDDILERQSEMIRYLRQHNMILGKRIVEIMRYVPKEKQQVLLDETNIPPPQASHPR